MTKTQVAPFEGPVLPPPPTDEGPVAIAESNDNSEGGKLKMIIQLLKKCLGVKDIASMYVLLATTGRSLY